MTPKTKNKQKPSLHSKQYSAGKSVYGKKIGDFRLANNGKFKTEQICC